MGGLGLMAAMRREVDVSPSLKMVEAAVADYRKGDTRQAVKSVLHDLRSRLPAAPPFTQEVRTCRPRRNCLLHTSRF